MKLKHARQILSGEIKVVTTIHYGDVFVRVDIAPNGSTLKSKRESVDISYDDFNEALRQLALKVMREKEKGR